jgi:predicted Zn-dependent protease with MMP-like domain
MTPAERIARRMPSDEDIDAIARRTLQRLPSPFAESLGDMVLRIEPVTDAETAGQLGLGHPMQLSGLYEGVSLNEWRSTRFSLEQLVAHIVIHEIGHHFGFSDDDMHALEDSAE